MAEDPAWGDGIDVKPFPALLIEIKKAGKTGILLAKKETVEKRIFFQDGEPIASRSNLKRDLLGEILCARGKITRDQLKEAVLEDQKKTGNNFGQILIKKGFLTPKDLYAECKYQFVSILFSLFSWENASYAFNEQEASTLIPKDLPKFHVAFSKLVSEGIRLIKDNSFIDRVLGDTNQVVRATSVTIPSGELSFRGEDKTILDQIDGEKAIQEIIDAADLDSSMTKKILYTLSCLGVVEIQAPAAALENKADITGSMEGQEEIPSMNESSLSTFMDEILPEEQAEEIPVFEQEEQGSVDYSKIVADEVEEEDENLPEQIGGAPVEEIQEIPPQVQPVTSEYESESQGQAPPPAEESEPIPMEDEQTASKADEIPFKTEDRPLNVWEKETEASGPAEGQEEEAILKEVMIQEKRRSTLTQVLLFLGVIVLMGGAAFFYFSLDKGSKINDFAERIRAQVTTRDFKARRDKEIVQKLMEKGQAQTAGESPVPGQEMKTAEAPAVQETPPEKQDTAEIRETQGEVKPAEEEKASEPSKEAKAGPDVKEPPAQTEQAAHEKIVEPSSKVQAETKPSAPAATLPSWNDLYAKGLVNFKNGNLKSAMKDWADLVRSAPDPSFTIQIEITSYLNFASKDIEEASKEEKVFILNALFNDKPAYKVLCGIYKDRSEAEASLQKLSPYLKAQKPVVISVERVRNKLVD